MADSYWSLDGLIDAFVTNLKARAGLAGIQVADSWPAEVQEPKSIWIDDATATEEVAGMRSGPIKNTESYSLFIVVDCYMEGGTTKAARDAVTPLVGEVLREVAERKRVTTTDDKVVSMRSAGWKYRPYVMKEGRGVAVRIEVRVLGRR